MKKNAKKIVREVLRSDVSRRQLLLAEVIKTNLYMFVVREGMKALDVVLEQEREGLCGPAGSHGLSGEAKRWGHTHGRLVMGGQTVSVRKPRVRQAGHEVQLPTWEQFADTDPLDERTLEQMTIGVSTRGYARSVEGVPPELEAGSTSKSATSRRLVASTKKRLDEWLKRDLSNERIVAIMIDGIEVGDYVVLVALGITETGEKQALGLWKGATENAVVCQTLLDNLIERGLDPRRRYLFVIDGSKAIRKAIRRTFGDRCKVQRCQEHKRRNVLGHLPKKLHAMANKAMRDAYNSKTADVARRSLHQLANGLDAEHPSAAASLREGLDETLTVKEMGLPEGLQRTLATTNPIENLNGSIRRVSKRVKKWNDPDMVRRWVALGILEAQKGFRRLRGYRSMPILVAALQQPIETVDEQEAAA